MIQAMTWALVLTSGAGMSRSGPMRTSISVANRRVSPSSSFWLSCFGSTMTPPLPPPYGMPDDRALPGHPHREGLDLVEADVLVVADAALGRAAAEVVLDAVAGEDLDRPVVHVDGEMDGQLAPRLAQDAAQAGVQLEPLGGQVELSLRDLPGIDRGRDVLGRHRRRTSSSGGIIVPPRHRGSSPGRPHGAHRAGPGGMAPEVRCATCFGPEYSPTTPDFAYPMVPVARLSQPCRNR